MSEKDQKDIPKAQETADDGDIENLSQTEKAAFEKIMAQIGEADEATDNADETKKPEPRDDEGATAEPIKEDQPVEPTETKEEADNSASEPNEEDELDDDQRSALDKIMAEIGNSDENDKIANASDDNGHEKGDPQGVSDENKPVVDTEETNTSDDADDDALSDDQQAALDQILSEINGDDKDSAPDPPPEAEDATSDQPKEAPQKDDSSNGLSMDEFDDELSSLLGTADGDATVEEKATDKTTIKEASQEPVDQSLEDINSALKDIVKGSDEKEPFNDTDPSRASDKEQVEEASEPELLKEVDAAPTPKNRKFAATSKKALLGAVITCTAALLAVGAYWGHGHYTALHSSAPDVAAAPEMPAEPDIASSSNATRSNPSTPISPLSSTPSSIANPNPFDALKEDIRSTRHYIQQKKDEILDLKRYYQNGIQEDRSMLLAKQPSKPFTFKAALENRQFKLGLKSIQRRATYNLKLDTPLSQIEIYLEQLLYLERRIRLFELLDDAISGLSLADLKRQGADLISNLRKEGELLSVENVNTEPPSLKSIWQELTLGNRADQSAQRAIPRSNPEDQKISKSICKGSFEQKYLLTTLTAQTAKCLANWPGKDMYLNGLTHLSPEAAKHLAKWPGEWLSLNGIKRLSSESAHHLSKWPGKRLSLNGVANLPDAATTYLAQWQGDQLEMVGLTSIGRWENYVTHLFLSESLRRELQVK